MLCLQKYRRNYHPSSCSYLRTYDTIQQRVVIVFIEDDWNLRSHIWLALRGNRSQSRTEGIGSLSASQAPRRAPNYRRIGCTGPRIKAGQPAPSSPRNTTMRLSSYIPFFLFGTLVLALPVRSSDNFLYKHCTESLLGSTG
jgi:hypothetical protein